MLNASRMMLAQIRELVGRGYSPLEVAQSMAMKLDDVIALINLLT